MNLEINILSNNILHLYFFFSSVDSKITLVILYSKVSYKSRPIKVKIWHAAMASGVVFAEPMNGVSWQEDDIPYRHSDKPSHRHSDTTPAKLK